MPTTTTPPRRGLLLKAISKENAVRTARRRLEQAENARDDAVRDALTGGWPTGGVANALELSQGRISQITRKGKTSNGR